MLLVTQIPISDARVFAGPDPDRLMVPDWPSPRTYGHAQFVRHFGHAVERLRAVDPAWPDEHVFCEADRAVALPALRNRPLGDPQTRFFPHCAFRRLLVDESRVVVRVEVGLSGSNRRRPMPPPTERQATAIALDAMTATSRVPASADGKVGPLVAQGRPLARLYVRATARGVDAAGNGRRPPLVLDGRPMLLVQFAEDEGFPVPDKATLLDESVLGGAKAAFIRLAVRPWGTVPAWFIAPGTAGPDRTRSLRLCLLRLHAEQEALDLILDQLRRGSIRYDPDTEVGSSITSYLNEATRRINKQSWGGVSQSAILAAIDAAESVRYIDDRSGVLDRLDGAQRQIRLKIEEYERRRRAERRVIVVQGGASYMERADNSVTITNSQVSRTNISPGARMEQVLMDFSGADVDQERKQAVADLHAEAKKLLDQLPDDKAKAQVEQRVEIITKQAEEDDPIEDIVRMAGQGLVEVGKKVEGMAEPISRVVNKVLDVLKFAPLVL